MSERNTVVSQSRRMSYQTALLLSMIFFFLGCQKKAEPPKPPPPPEVFYVVPATETLRQHEEFSGRTTSSRTVEIHARVSGHLAKVLFKDGAKVTAGENLFQIEDSIYKSLVDQAKANVKQTQANLAKLQSQLRRSEKLIGSKTISQEEFETLQFQTAEAKAASEAAAALRDQAIINLGYTKVESPLTGRINRRQVDEGNLVKADTTVLATVVSSSPIYCYFDFDERTVILMRRMVEERKMKSAPDFDADVQVALAGEDDFTLHGKIDWVDNQIDPGTGTLRARVSIDNPSIDESPSDKSNEESAKAENSELESSTKLVSPGMFVRLLVPIGPTEPVMLIPEEALGSDQGQRFVYIIDANNKIEYRRVDVGWLTNGRRVIRKGLNLDDRVVVSGLQRVRPKTEVKPTDFKKYQAEKLAEAAKVEKETSPKTAAPNSKEHAAVVVAPAVPPNAEAKSATK